MELPLTIIFLGFLIFFSHFLNSIFDRTKIPNALLLLLLGLAVGPVGKLVSPEDFGAVGPVFTTVTLIVLLFESGVDLEMKTLRGALTSSTLVTVFNFVITSLVATVVAFYLTDIDHWVSASFFGVIVGGTSSAVVIPIIKQLNMNEAGETILMLESALSDVLCLIIGLGLLSAMESGIFNIQPLIWSVLSSLVLASLIGIVAGIFWSAFLGSLRRIKNYTFTNVAMAFVIYGLTDLMGINGGIATLAFGITLGNANLFKFTALSNFIDTDTLSKTERNFMSEIVFLFQTYFFVYVGVCIRFGDPLVFVLALLIVLGMLIFRPVTIKYIVKQKMSLMDRSIMSIMGPKGLVPAILASLPVQLGIMHGLIIQDLAYAVVLISIFVCAMLVSILSKRANSLAYYRFFFKDNSESN